MTDPGGPDETPPSVFLSSLLQCFDFSLHVLLIRVHNLLCLDDAHRDEEKQEKRHHSGWSEHNASVTGRNICQIFKKNVQLPSTLSMNNEQVSRNLHLLTLPIIQVLMVKRYFFLELKITNSTNNVNEQGWQHCPKLSPLDSIDQNVLTIRYKCPFLSFTGNFSHQQGDGTSFSPGARARR